MRLDNFDLASQTCEAIERLKSSIIPTPEPSQGQEPRGGMLGIWPSSGHPSEGIARTTAGADASQPYLTARS